MDLNKLTMKSQAALEPEHVLFALLTDPEGVIYPLFDRLGVSARSVRDRVDEALDRLPKVYAQGAGTQVGLSQPAVSMLERAFAEAEALTDEYVSTDHLLLALVDSPGAAGRILKDAGETRDGVLGALAQVRGRQR